MAQDWNPNSTATKGMEWFPHTAGVVTLDSALKIAAMGLRQTVAEVTATARVRVGAIGVRGGLYVVEVFDNETAVPANLTSVSYVSSAEVSGSGATQWTDEAGATLTIYTHIDEAPGALNTADYIKYTNSSGIPSWSNYISRVGSGAFPAAKRVLAVTVTAVVASAWAYGFQLGLEIGGVVYPSTNLGYGVGGGTQQTIAYTWYYNPATKAPWTIAAVQAFAAGANGMSIYGVSGLGDMMQVFQQYMTVTYCDENRIGVGTLDDTGSALTPSAYNTATMLTPIGGAWTKDGAGYHLWTVRRINSTGSLDVVYLDALAAPNPGRGYLPTLDATYGYATAMGSALTWVLPIVSRTSAPADSADAQPYASIVEAKVFTGQTARAEFSNAAATTYRNIKTLVKSNSATQPLIVRIRRVSDGVQLGGTLTLTKATVDALPAAGSGGWRYVDSSLTFLATLATATQYYIEYVSACTGAGSDYWSVPSVSGETFGGTASFGGTTDASTINGGARDTASDLVGTVTTVPTTPAGFAATLQNLTVAATCAGTTRVQYARLAWTATALAASFTRYEIRRSEDAGVTWSTIAYVTTEAVVTWSDYEGKRGVAACYGIRVIRSDGSASDWSGNSCVTPNLVGCELVLASNYTPTLTSAWEYDADAAIPFDFLEADQLQYLPTFQRDRLLGYRQTENPGARAKYLICAGFNTATPAAGTGLAGFDRLRALAVAVVPYIALLDRHGNRYLVGLRAPRGDFEAIGDSYLAELEATEIATSPYVVTVTS